MKHALIATALFAKTGFIEYSKLMVGALCYTLPLMAVGGAWLKWSKAGKSLMTRAAGEMADMERSA